MSAYDIAILNTTFDVLSWLNDDCYEEGSKLYNDLQKQYTSCFTKRCTSLFQEHPVDFLMLCKNDEFREKIHIFHLEKIVDEIIFGKSGEFRLENDEVDGIHITWRGLFTCNAIFE
jgi:hypothetical protein